jgi:DNA-binding winged helix-turn-helix (wHTH) protein
VSLAAQAKLAAPKQRARRALAVIFRFGHFELDEAAGLLRKAGEPVAIQPKPFELLCILLRERARVVPTEELFERLWPDTVVTPGSLNRAISHARKAIDDTHKGERIRSVPRRGYRFAGDVVALAPGAPPQPSAPVRTPVAAGSAAFVGRGEALQALRDAFAAAESGRGGVALVTGPPGIGKTRLVEVFAAEVAQRGPVALIGRSREGEGVPAFWLWAQILRQLLSEPTLGADARDLAAASGELAGLVPELAASPAARAESSPEQNRFQLFDALTRMLARASRRRPLLLVLEDLQWAGSASLRLLEHLAYEIGGERILILGSVRDEARERGHPLHRTLPLLRQRDCAQVALRPFTRAEVGEVLTAAVGRRPPAEVTSELFARTEGVPLYLREAIRLLAERGELAHLERVARHGIHLPGNAIDFIRRALDTLSPECAELVAAASALGREFSLPLAASVSGIARERGLDLLDEAERAGVVEAVPGSAATWRFSHALHQEAAYASLPAGVRARLHQRVADRLEHLHAGDPEPVIAELAHHHHRALAVGDPELAYTRAWSAAERAATLFAYEQSALHYEQASAALLHCEPVDPGRRFETLLAQAAAHRRCGERTRSREALIEAMQIARSLERPLDFARAAIAFCDPADWAVYDPPARAAVDEAAARLGQDRSVHAARIAVRLAWLSSRSARRSAENAARRALALTREHGDAQATLEAVYTLQLAIAGPEHLETRAPLADEFVALGGRVANRDLALIGLVDAATDRLEAGDVAAARARRAAAGALAGEKPHPALAWHLAIFDTGIAMLEGRFEDAARWMHDALTYGQRIEHPYAHGCYASHRGDLHGLRGEPEGVCAWFEPMTRLRGGPRHWSLATLARADFAAGREAEARAHFETLAAEGFADVPPGIRYLRSLVELGHLCADLADASRAAQLRELLAPFERRHALMAAPVLYGGPVSFALARLCEAGGRSDEACALYEVAAADCDELGARPMRAQVWLRHGLLRARRGDRRLARELLSQSAALAESLGMQGVADAARARVE